MRNLLLTSILTIVTGSAAQPAKCVNPSLQWVINPLYIDGVTVSAIQGDGLPYTDGQNGNAVVLNVCSGSYDATLNMGARRKASVSFAGLLSSNANTPSWASQGTTVTDSYFMNVRNLGFVPTGASAATEFTFTTRMNAAGLHFITPTPDAPSTAVNLPIANTPCNDSPVVVHHCPKAAASGGCPALTHETWYVYAAAALQTCSGTPTTNQPPTQVATLIDSKTTPGINQGEFSVPFYFTISVQ